jgi:hypothetical protein
MAAKMTHMVAPYEVASVGLDFELNGESSD